MMCDVHWMRKEAARRKSTVEQESLKRDRESKENETMIMLFLVIMMGIISKIMGYSEADGARELGVEVE